MARPATRNNNPVPNPVPNRRAREAPARRIHVGEPGPRQIKSREIQSVDGRRREGEVEGVRSGVELGAAEDIEVVAEGDGGEVGEAVEVGAAWERGERGPGGRRGIEEEGADEGGVRGEEAEDVARRQAEEAPERGGGSVREECVPRAACGAEAGAV